MRITKQIIILLFICISCEKETNHPLFETIEGRWIGYESCGGFSPYCYSIQQYEFKFIDNGKFKFYKSNEYFTCGEIDILKDYTSHFKITLSSRKKIDLFSYFPPTIHLLNFNYDLLIWIDKSDTLWLEDTCSDCFYYLFLRK
jgi:hypothetical protein